MEFTELIARIKKKARELHANGVPLEHAYDRAVTLTIMDVAEQEISDFQARILRALQVMSPREDSPPVKTGSLLMKVGGLETRYQAWYHLKALERKGLVYRPGGQNSKGGWKASEAI